MVDKIERAAHFLAELRASHRVEDDIPSEFRPTQLNEAYAVQESMVGKLLRRHGGRPIGYKTACTNASAQKLLNVANPLYGRLISPLVFSSPTELSAEKFRHRCIEAEFAFELAVNVPTGDVPYTAVSIAQFVRAVLPSIEIVDWRFRDWTSVGALSLVADNAIHGAWIPGASYRDWYDLDLSTHRVQLTVNGEVTRRGNGGAVLGNPLTVLAWLANELAVQGRTLHAGDMVTTGLVTEVYLAHAGDIIQADFGTIGSVHLRFT